MAAGGRALFIFCSLRVFSFVLRPVRTPLLSVAPPPLALSGSTMDQRPYPPEGRETDVYLWCGDRHAHGRRGAHEAQVGLLQAHPFLPGQASVDVAKEWVGNLVVQMMPIFFFFFVMIFRSAAAATFSLARVVV